MVESKAPLDELSQLHVTFSKVKLSLAKLNQAIWPGQSGSPWFGEPVDSFLRQCRSAEDRALVRLEHRQPAGEVGGVIRSGLQGDPKICTKEGCTDFGNIS